MCRLCGSVAPKGSTAVCQVCSRRKACVCSARIHSRMTGSAPRDSGFVCHAAGQCTTGRGGCISGAVRYCGGGPSQPPGESLMLPEPPPTNTGADRCPHCGARVVAHEAWTCWWCEAPLDAPSGVTDKPSVPVAGTLSKVAVDLGERP